MDCYWVWFSHPVPQFLDACQLAYKLHDDGDYDITVMTCRHTELNVERKSCGS